MVGSTPAPEPPRMPAAVAMSHEYAGPWRRLVAWLIDYLLWFMCTTALAFGAFWLVSQTGDCRDGDAELCSNGELGAFILGLCVGGCLLPPLYSILSLSVRGRTVGMQAVGIRAEAEDQLSPRWGLRWLVGYLPLLIPVLGWIAFLAVRLPILWDPRRLGFHDRVARAIVVRST